MSKDEKPSEETAAAPAAPEAVAPPSRLKRLFARINGYIWSRSPSKGVMIFVGICLVILMSLGTWQVMRLHQKNELLNSIKEKISAPLLDQTKKYPRTPEEWKKLTYQPILLEGAWVNLHSFKLIPRTYEGQVGYQWLVPLQLPDQQVVLIDRGFVPDGQAILPSRESDKVTVQGIGLVPPERKPWQTPENIPSRGLWTWLDMTALQHEIGVRDMAPIVVYELRTPGSDEYPIGGQFPTPANNRHAQYAMTWYMLALVLLFITFIASGPRTTKAGATPSNKIADPVAERGMYPEATD